MRAGWYAVAAAALLATSTVRAEIYEWRDASGARHFTNNKQGVPAEYQASTRILVADWQSPPDVPVPAAAASTAPAPAQRAEVVADAVVWDAGYQAGVQDAMIDGGGGGGGGGAVQINGPLAVATSRASESMPGFGYGLYPPWPWYYPFVTTGFDRGRSRHQTLRMLLQDQFQIDRDGPYAYDRWDEPGLGPALAPFLNRGLPFPVQQYGRVIYR
jgi:hypothetical protein